MSASELADWWDQQKAQSDKALEEWVQDNPQWWAIGIATFTATAMDLGAGMVDALRLGEGVAKGTPGGVATDAMRLLALAGPLGKLGGTLGGLIGRMSFARNLKVAVSLKGVTGPCTFTAVNNAASLLGGKGRNLFLTVRQAAEALGKPMAKLAKDAAGNYKLAAWIDDLIPFLTKQGMRVRSLGVPKTIDDVISAANAHNGVVIFAIEWTDLASVVRRHSMIAVKTLQGVRFADYGGKFITSLAELASRGGVWPKAVGTSYRIASTASKGNAVLVGEQATLTALERYGLEVMKGGLLLLEGLHALETPDAGVDIAIPVEPAAAIETAAHEPEVIKQSFAAFKARKAGKPVIRLDPMRIVGRRNGPPRSDWLTGVQYRLNALGFGAGLVDGINGPRTKRAVREFQRTYMSAADVDEIPGPRTQARLVEVCGF